MLMHLPLLQLRTVLLRHVVLEDWMFVAAAEHQR